MEFLADRVFEKDPNLNLLAREIAHPWWQNLIVPKTPQDLWLKEGFANYSALLYQESISGEAGFAREVRETAVAALLYPDKIRNAYQLPLLNTLPQKRSTGIVDRAIFLLDTFVLTHLKFCC